jgi:gluconate 2-dehydrogenase gamma chain
MPISRREWMLASICWSELLARRMVHGAAAFLVLSPSEAMNIRALTAGILPETETPGAEQAGVVHFIDAALAGYDHDQLELYRQGLSDVTARSRQMFPPSNNFIDLFEAQRTALLKIIEKTEFFEKLRTHTILAYFGNPQFGWKLMGRDPAVHFEPPFGFYDAEVKAE